MAKYSAAYKRKALAILSEYTDGDHFTNLTEATRAVHGIGRPKPSKNTIRSWWMNHRAAEKVSSSFTDTAHRRSMDKKIATISPKDGRPMPPNSEEMTEAELLQYWSDWAANMALAAASMPVTMRSAHKFVEMSVDYAAQAKVARERDSVPDMEPEDFEVRVEESFGKAPIMVLEAVLRVFQERMGVVLLAAREGREEARVMADGEWVPGPRVAWR